MSDEIDAHAALARLLLPEEPVLSDDVGYISFEKVSSMLWYVGKSSIYKNKIVSDATIHTSCHASGHVCDAY